MDRPRVTVHSLISVDGRLDGFPADLGLYYDLAARIPHQAVLSGSGTILAAAAAEGVDFDAPDPPRPPGPARAEDAELPWMVVVDSRGRVRRLGWLRSVPYWRDVVVLCSEATPKAHRERLRAAGVRHEVAGGGRVDLAAGLQLLATAYGVRQVRVDAGPGLVGALLDAGMVDEVSLVVAPYVAGHGPEHALHLFGGSSGIGGRHLVLGTVEQLRDGHIWTKYDLASPP